MTASYDEGTELEKLELHSEYFSGNLRAEAELVMIKDHYLFTYRPPDRGSAAFWYYECVGGPATNTKGEVVEGPRVVLVFSGWATDLDGVRHLYFADNGYVFYPEGVYLPEALTELYRLCPCSY